jgi:hypothetical protein
MADVDVSNPSTCLCNLNFGQDPSRCVQVTEGAYRPGLRLWVAREDDIEGYGLGRMESCVEAL